MQLVLYRVYDIDSNLLYIGQSLYFPARLHHHKEHKDWWKDIHSIHLEHFDNYDKLKLAEQRAIATEDPLHNKHRFNGHHKPREITKLPNKSLPELVQATDQFNLAIDNYRVALTKARDAGATWAQIADAIGTSEGSARVRHRVAQHGGELHISCPELPTIDQA